MLHWYIKYSMDKLSVVSLNAQALKNKMKRTALFSYLKQKKFDLEETHVTARDIVVWKKNNGDIEYSLTSERIDVKGKLYGFKTLFRGIKHRTRV